MIPVDVIDSHTAGEPTRVVLHGGPELGCGSIAERLEVLRQQQDHWRSALVNEPRGSDVLVGALLLEPADTSCVAGVIFFNNVGYLGMCGHGAIGVVTTLAHLGRIQPGDHRLETPVGVVTATLHPNGEVSVTNVPSYRLGHQLTVEVPGIGQLTGDIAWGGNWFFLVDNPGPPLLLEHVESLTNLAWRIRQVLKAGNITGADGHEIDHIELLGPPSNPGGNARNFVLCPGKAYDRSPCGTGTSAKLACLAADSQLAEGEFWVQEGILGTTFTGHYRRDGDRILPTITGSAFITGESRLRLDERDPFCWGIR